MDEAAPVDTYIAAYPPEVQARLLALRKRYRELAC